MEDNVEIITFVWCLQEWNQWFSQTGRRLMVWRQVRVKPLENQEKNYWLYRKCSRWHISEAKTLSTLYTWNKGYFFRVRMLYIDAMHQMSTLGFLVTWYSSKIKLLKSSLASFTSARLYPKCITRCDNLTWQYIACAFERFRVTKGFPAHLNYTSKADFRDFCQWVCHFTWSCPVFKLTFVRQVLVSII